MSGFMKKVKRRLKLNRLLTLLRDFWLVRNASISLFWPITNHLGRLTADRHLSFLHETRCQSTLTLFTPWRHTGSQISRRSRLIWLRTREHQSATNQRPSKWNWHVLAHQTPIASGGLKHVNFIFLAYSLLASGGLKHVNFTLMVVDWSTVMTFLFHLC